MPSSKPIQLHKSPPQVINEAFILNNASSFSHFQSPLRNSYLHSGRHRRDIPVLDMLAEVIADGSKCWMDFHAKFAFVANHLPLLEFGNIFQVSKSLFEHTSINH